MTRSNSAGTMPIQAKGCDPLSRAKNYQARVSQAIGTCIVKTGHQTRYQTRPHHRNAEEAGCYSAKQAFVGENRLSDARYQAFLNLRPRTTRVESRKALGAAAGCLARLLGCRCGLRVSVVENRRKRTPLGDHFR